MFADEGHGSAHQQSRTARFVQRRKFAIIVFREGDVVDVERLMPGFPKRAVHVGQRAVVLLPDLLSDGTRNLVGAPTQRIVALPKGIAEGRFDEDEFAMHAVISPIARER